MWKQLVIVVVLSATATCVLIVGHFLLQRKDSTDTSITSSGKMDERFDTTRKRQLQRGYVPELDFMHSNSGLRTQAEKPGDNSRNVLAHEKDIQQTLKYFQQSGDKSIDQRRKRGKTISPKMTSFDVSRNKLRCPLRRKACKQIIVLVQPDSKI